MAERNRLPRRQTHAPGIACLVIILLSPLTNVRSQISAETQSRYKTALKMIGENETGAAIAELKSILSEHPLFSQAYRRLAEAYVFNDNFEEARRYFQDLLRKNPQNAYAYYALARIDFATEKYDDAIAKMQKSIELDPNFVEAYGYPAGLTEVYRRKNDLNRGIQYFRRLLQINSQNACALYGLGRSYLHLYKWQQAQEFLTRAIEFEPNLTLVYHSIIFIFLRTSKYDQVVRYCQMLRQQAQQNLDFEMQVYANQMLGNAYFVQGDYSRSLRFLSEALKGSKDIGNKRREGSSLNTIAAVYAMSSEFSKALKYFNEALQLARDTNSKLTEVQALSNIGNVLKDQGEDERALEIYRKVVKTAHDSKIKYLESLTLSNMAEIFENKNDYEQALQYQKKSLAITTEIEDKAQQGFILRNIGGLYQQLGENSLALNNLFQALKIGVETKDIQVQWETEAALGSAYRKQGDRNAAIRHYTNAIAIYDSVRNNLDIESLKNNFLEDKYRAYPSIVQLLAQQGHTEKAFAFAEKYKAKSLLDILSQGNLFKDLLADTLQLELREITAQQEKAHRQLSVELTKAKKNQSKTLSLEQKITDLELRQAAILTGLRKKHADYYRLTSPEILTPAQFRNNFLNDGQALLEYIVGDTKLSVFLLTKDTLSYRQLPAGRDQLERMLTELSPIFATQKKASEASKAIFDPQTVDFTIPPAHRLYELLIKPIEPAINQITELIIVPDDLLFYLPFEMLVSDTTATETRYDFEKAEFLLEKYSISYLSSASLLDPGLQRSRTPSKGVLAFGNPTFGPRHELLPSAKLVASKDGDIDRFETDETLLPLPSSESEVQAIGEVLSGATRIFTGIAATENNFRKEAGKYTVLHLATHFLANDNQPLYSKIALAQADNPKTDGYLQTYEVFNLNLNADLAVLSACNTGLGKLRKGQGLIGISRAFTFAGVPSLVVSLWNVDDESTSMIMRNFYQNLKAGLNKKQSLRLAKLSYLNSSQASRQDPFYWAPFILLGDASPIQLQRQSSSLLPLIFLVVVIGLSVLFFLKKTRLANKQA